MKRVLEKFIIVLLVVILLNNFIFSNYVYAQQSPVESAGKLIVELIQDVIGTFIGQLAIIPKIAGLAIGAVINSLTAAVAYSQNDTFELPAISPFNVIFNDVKIVEIDFFTIEDDGSIVMTIRAGVAAWYYVMRTIAVTILLVILVYVGIRMALTSIAQDKAVYKKMLTDWAVSLALVFLIQYIIIFTLEANKSLVNGLQAFMDSNSGVSKNIEHAYLELFKMALGIDIESIAATIIYCMLVWQTLGIFISYFNRMLKLAFLIIISPLITLTYSIDKMGDGKAQALGNWLKEFVFTILLQPFHCIIYMSMVSIAFSFLIGTTNGTITDNIPVIFDAHNNSLSYAIIAILCVRFVKEAEKIVRKIFQFQDDGSTGLDKGLVASAAILKFSGKAGMAGAKGINSAKNFIASNPERIRDIKAGAMVAASFLPGKGGKDGLSGTLEQRRDQALTKVEERDAEKITSKLSDKSRRELERYGLDRGSGRFKPVNGKDNKELAEIAENIRKQEPSMSPARAMARARLQLAQDKRKDEKAANFARKHPKISSATSRYKKWRSSEQGKIVSRMVAKQISAGAAIFAGASAFGTGQGGIEAIMLGTGAYGGSMTMYERTNKSLSIDAAKSFSALKCKNSTDVRNTVNKILANQDDYQENSKHMNELLERLKAALKQLNVEDPDKYTKEIHTRLKHAIKTGHTDEVEEILKQTFPPEIAGNENVVSAVNGLNLFENEKAILGTINDAQQSDIPLELFMAQTTSSLYDMGAAGEDNSSEPEQQEKSPEEKRMDDVEQKGADSTTIETVVSPEQKKQEEEFIERMEEEKIKLEKERERHAAFGYNVNEDEIKNLEEAIDEVKRKIKEYEEAIDETEAIMKTLSAEQQTTELTENDVKDFIQIYVTSATNDSQSQMIKNQIAEMAQKYAGIEADSQTPHQKNILAINNEIQRIAQRNNGSTTN